MKTRKSSARTSKPAAKKNTAKRSATSGTTRRAQAKPKAKTTAAKAVPTLQPTKTAAEKASSVYTRNRYKGTFNTHDIMHAPVEKTIRMLEKIISGERLFTM